jgi:hypothetical protein
MIGYASFLLIDQTAGFAVVALTNANGDGPVSETFARAAAALYEGLVSGPIESLAPAVWATAEAGADAQGDLETGPLRPRVLDRTMLGQFEGEAGRVEVRATAVGADRSTIEIVFDGESSPLEWDWWSRVLTRHPSLRQYPLEFDGRNWLWGPEVFRPAGTTTETADGHAPAEDLGPYCGHFRTFNPWFTNFRTFVREGRLILTAPPGVEAPSEDIELVQLETGVFRMGADWRAPERLEFGPVIDGVARWVDRDGCRYSRSFTA